MWFPKKENMGKLQMATVEELQPFRDTWTAAERALLEAGPGLGPDYLEDNEMVIQKNANNKLRIGVFLNASLEATQCLAVLLPPLSPCPRSSSWSG